MNIKLTWRAFLLSAGLGLAYYAAARLGLALAFAHTNASPVWPPSGLALAALLLLGPGRWPGVLAGALVANLVEFTDNGALSGVTAVTVSAVIAAGNTLEALAGAWLLRRIAGPAPALDRPTTVYAFAAVAAGVALIGASIGVSSLWLAHVVPVAALRKVALIWWLGDTAGMMVITPLCLAWLRPGTGWRWDGRTVLITVAGLGVLGLTLNLLFGRHYNVDLSYRALAFLLLPTLSWTSYRYGMRGITLLLLLVSGAAVVGTTKGLGPFSAGTLDDALFGLEIFIGLCSMVGMVLASDRHVHGRPAGHGEGGAGRGGLLYMLHWTVLLVCLALTILVWQFVVASTEQR
ncbi:MAG: MASE1 domain-containing protein, partial [Pseudomonadota bacterium]